MTVLPKFLYLFQCIPLYIPKSFFKSLDRAFTSFLWDEKKPRIRLELLQRPKNSGGLALPNFCYYYWASNIYKVMHWLYTPDMNWCILEAASCISTSLRALVTSSLPISASKFTNNPVVINTLKIWSQFRQSFGIGNLIYLSPILNNHNFPQARQDSEFII